MCSLMSTNKYITNILIFYTASKLIFIAMTRWYIAIVFPIGKCEIYFNFFESPLFKADYNVLRVIKLVSSLFVMEIPVLFVYIKNIRAI